MTRERLSDHNVVGILSGMDAAREAIVALGRAGVESDKVSLLGRLAEEAAAAPDTRERDLRAVKHVAKGAGLGAAAGGALGGIGGLVAGATALQLPGIGAVVAAGIWAGLAGSTVGAFVGGVASVDLSEDWELTYQSVHDGNVLVAVHGDSEDEARQATAVFEATGAESIRRFDARGRRVS